MEKGEDDSTLSLTLPLLCGLANSHFIHEVRSVPPPPPHPALHPMPEPLQWLDPGFTITLTEHFIQLRKMKMAQIQDNCNVSLRIVKMCMK